LKFGIFQRRLPGRDGLGDCLAQRMDPGRFGGASVGVHRAQRLQQLSNLARLAERGNAHRVQGGKISGGGNFFAETSLERVNRQVKFLGFKRRAA